MIEIIDIPAVKPEDFHVGFIIKEEIGICVINNYAISMINLLDNPEHEIIIWEFDYKNED